MGFNYRTCGYSDIDSFVQAMFESESKHLDAFVALLRTNKLDAPLREHRWADFARGYNGPKYAENKYDEKTKAAFEKHSGITEAITNWKKWV